MRQGPLQVSLDAQGAMRTSPANISKLCAAFACVDSVERLRVCDVFQWTRRGSRRRGSNFVSVGIRCLASSDQQPSESKPRLPIRKSTHVSVLRAFATAFSSRPETDGGG